MALVDQDMKAAIAVTRFGLGAKPGELDEARKDPQGFLKSQIRRTGADVPARDDNGPARSRATKKGDELPSPHIHSLPGCQGSLAFTSTRRRFDVSGRLGVA